MITGPAAPARRAFFICLSTGLPMIYRLKDAFYLKAKKEGYRSRAAYKLLELNERFDLIRPGDRVVDLGAAPGGWLQVAGQLAGPKGKVVGVDLQPISVFKEGNTFALQGDMTSEETKEKIKGLLGSYADCVLSDVAPRLSGIHHADVARSVDLAFSALKLAIDLLRTGGNFLVKTFVGEEAKPFALELKKHFRSVQATRPESTRKGSSEIYYRAKGFRKLRLEDKPPAATI